MNEANQSNSGIELDLIDLSGIPELQNDDLNTFKAPGNLEALMKELEGKVALNKVLHTFSAQIDEINNIIKMKYASTRDIASVILKDVALSSRVLNLVNSSFYGQFSDKGISSISEAMVILGTEEIKQAAASLLLFDFMQDISQSEILKEKSLAGLMRGMMAKEIATESNYKHYDEFQICAMLYDIGEQIILFCHPDDYKRIQVLAQKQNMDMEIASRKILGAPFTEIGKAIAAKWGFPKNVVETIEPVNSHYLDPKNLSTKHLKILVSSFTNELSSIDWRFGVKRRMKDLESIVVRYGNVLEIGVQKAENLLSTSMDRIEKHAKLLKINLGQSRFDRHSQPDEAFGMDKDSSASLPSTSSSSSRNNENKIFWVEKQIKQIEDSMDAPFKLSEILLNVIKTIHNGFNFSRISVCIMNKQKHIMAVRFVLGDDLEHFGRKFHFKLLNDGEDVFNKALTTGLDMVVEDVRSHGNSNWIPEWYKKADFADAFSVYPLIVEGKRMGLIYVDWQCDRNHFFSDDVKRLMVRLKHLVEKAIRKSRRG